MSPSSGREASLPTPSNWSLRELVPQWPRFFFIKKTNKTQLYRVSLSVVVWYILSEMIFSMYECCTPQNDESCLQVKHWGDLPSVVSHYDWLTGCWRKRRCLSFPPSYSLYLFKFSFVYPGQSPGCLWQGQRSTRSHVSTAMSPVCWSHADGCLATAETPSMLHNKEHELPATNLLWFSPFLSSSSSSPPPQGTSALFLPSTLSDTMSRSGGGTSFLLVLSEKQLRHRHPLKETFCRTTFLLQQHFWLLRQRKWHICSLIT